MTDLLDRLQTALAGHYAIERELGQGGMARVYLGEDRKHHRKVAVKVLKAEVAAGVGANRFFREIEIAAQLQHPHILPLYDSGETEGFLYYVMPYVQGEPLSATLDREGELPVDQAVRILRDIVDALAYAHAQGLVHRDIKPDNVMLSGNHALVTDFGVAKALSGPTAGGTTLTSMGVALGTPAYMAPEQAAASPHIDHRADIYAVGVLAYEMLGGRLPFTASTPQAMLSAHVTQTPEPLAKHRSAVPPSLNALVMRCLEKKPADRWQRVDDLLPLLDSAATPSGGMTPTSGTQPVAAVDAAVRLGHPVRVAAMFGGASLIVLGVVYLLMIQLGLPDWVFAGGVALLVVGLPIMIATGNVERRRAMATTSGFTPPGGLHGMFTWRRAMLGGVTAFAALGVFTAAYMTMRTLGIGPVGTLMASGVLEERSRLVLADFQNRTTDSALGGSLTEALRVGLAQSPVLKVVDAATVGQALQRMNRDPATPLASDIALEVAAREGIPAIVIGEVGPIGRGYVLSARVMSAADGSDLLTVGETAADDAQLIAAIGELSGKLRERIGESLKTIRGGEPLDKVTTTSLEALRLFTKAIRTAHIEGDIDDAIPLLEDAIALDSGFAMAYRQLSVLLGNSEAEPTRMAAAATKAFAFRDRLPEIERYQATAFYYMNADYDRDQASRAYRALLERDPDNIAALNNLAVIRNGERRFAEAESLATRGLEVSGIAPLFFNKHTAETGQGELAAARATVDLARQRLPDSPYPLMWHAYLVSSVDGDYDEMEAAFSNVERTMEPDLVWHMYAELARIGADQVRGKLSGSEGHIRRFMRVAEERQLPRDYLTGAMELGYVDVRYRDAPDDGLRRVEAALHRYPLASMPPGDRPYAQLAGFYATVGRTSEAKRLLGEFQQLVPEGLRRREPLRHAARGAIAMTERRGADAVAAFRQRYDEGAEDCITCGLFEIAQAYELAEETDSAVAYYERAVATPSNWKVTRQYYWLAQTYKRLAEIYESRGEAERAVENYNAFVELWTDADAELQPIVRDVRARIARLVGENP